MSNHERKTASTPPQISSSHAESAMNSRATPGPWTIEYDNDANGHFVEWLKVGPARIYIYNNNRDQANIDAALIAASPDLLRAAERSLQYVLLAHHDGKKTGLSKKTLSIAERDYTLIEAAIKKARIAAAPDTAAERDRLKAVNADLLEALENIATWLIAPDITAIQEMFNLAHTAITKAKANGAT